MQTSQVKPSSPSTYKNSTPQSKLLEIKREFSVPVERLFEAFTTPEALKAWWWPNGLHADRIDLDFREGGKYFINMKGTIPGADGKNHDASGGMTGEFEEIVENERLVMTDHFADEKGRAISAKEAKMPGDWPQVVYITFDFDSTDENTSGFRLSQQGIPDEMQKDCVQGWSQSFDKLEKYLSGRKN